MSDLAHLALAPSFSRSAQAMASYPTTSGASLTRRTSFGEYSYINRYSINLRSFICRSTRELWKMVSEVSRDRIIPSVNKRLSAANRTLQEVPSHVHQVSEKSSNTVLAPAPAYHRPPGQFGRPVGSHFMGDHLPSTCPTRSYRWRYETIGSSPCPDGELQIIGRNFLRKNRPSNPVCSLRAHISNTAQSNTPSFFLYENPSGTGSFESLAWPSNPSHKRDLARRQDGR